jgi:hypothetical protein
MLSQLAHEHCDSVEREAPSPRRQRGSERVPRPAHEGLHIWCVGFAGAAAERVQRSSERVGRLERCFGDCWRLVQYVMPCYGGALVRRPDLLVVNADQLSRYDLEWLHEVGGPLPVWYVSSTELLGQGEASLAQRLRTVARAAREDTVPAELRAAAGAR